MTNRGGAAFFSLFFGLFSLLTSFLSFMFSLFLDHDHRCRLVFIENLKGIFKNHDFSIASTAKISGGETSKLFKVF
jgi:hypothetical protein